MATIYKKTKGDITYFSTKAVDADSQLQSKLTLLNKNVEAGLMTHDQADVIRKSLQEAPAGVEEVSPSATNLETITNIYNLLAPIAREVRAAQIEMTVDLLKSGGVEVKAPELRRLTGESPKMVRAWCDEPAAKGAGEKKSGKVREGFSTTLIRELDDLVAEAAAKAPGRRTKSS